MSTNNTSNGKTSGTKDSRSSNRANSPTYKNILNGFTQPTHTTTPSTPTEATKPSSLAARINIGTTNTITNSTRTSPTTDWTKPSDKEWTKPVKTATLTVPILTTTVNTTKGYCDALTNAEYSKNDNNNNNIHEDYMNTDSNIIDLTNNTTNKDEELFNTAAEYEEPYDTTGFFRSDFDDVDNTTTPIKQNIQHTTNYQTITQEFNPRHITLTNNSSHMPPPPPRGTHRPFSHHTSPIHLQPRTSSTNSIANSNNQNSIFLAPSLNNQHHHNNINQDSIGTTHNHTYSNTSTYADHDTDNQSIDNNHQTQESELIITTSDLAQQHNLPHHPNHPPPTTNIIHETTEKRNIGYNNNIEIQTRLALEGRVFNYEQAMQRKCMVIKFSINTNSATNEAPTYNAIEQVLYVLKKKANLDKPVDIVAIFNFADPIQTKSGAIYISYAYISPKSTQQYLTNRYTPFYIIMHTRISDQLRLPNPTYKQDNNMTPLAQHLSITIPTLNAMNEKLVLVIEGLHPKFILGNKQNTNTDNNRHLGYTFHRAVILHLHKRLPKDFPPPNNRCQTANFISTKLVHSNTSPKEQSIPPCLGIVITTEEPAHTAMMEAFHIITSENIPIHLFNQDNPFSINIHPIPPNPQDRNTLFRQIAKSNKEYTYSTYKLVRGITVNHNIFLDSKNTIALVSVVPHCTAVFIHFDTNGKLSLAALFQSTRDTMFFTAAIVADAFSKVLPHVIDTNHHIQSRPTAPTPTPIRSTQQHQNNRNTPNTTQRTTHTDRSTSFFRPSNVTNLNLIQPSNKCYVIANGAGGIAVANIYVNDNFDQNLRAAVDCVPYSRHKAFPTYDQAFTWLQYFYPHIRSKEEMDYINANCCSDTSNVNNPSAKINTWINKNYELIQSRTCYFYDHLSPNAKQLRLNCDERRNIQGLLTHQSYTFEPNKPAINTSSKNNERYLNEIVKQTHQMNFTSPPSQIVVPHPPQQHLTSHSSPQQHPPQTNRDSAQHNNDTISNLDDSSSHKSFMSNPTPIKRQRYSLLPQHLVSPHTPIKNPPSLINISIPLQLPKSEFTTLIYKELDKIDLPHTTISHIIKTKAHDHIQLLNTIAVQLTIKHTQHTTQIYQALQQVCGPENSLSLSREEFHTEQPRDIDTTPHIPTISSFPLHCPIRSCFAHNRTQPVFTDDNQGQLTAIMHTQQLHSDVLHTVPIDTLERMGWYRCCQKCNKLFLQPMDQSNHSARCDIYLTQHLNHTPTSTQPTTTYNTTMSTSSRRSNATTPKPKDD